MSGMTNMEGSTSSAGPQLVPKDDHGLPAQKERRRFARSAQACHSCRNRKRKCGGTPPFPCLNCMNDEMTCLWPTEDGRRSSVRRERAKRAKSLQSNEKGEGVPEASYDIRTDVDTWMGPQGESSDGRMDLNGNSVDYFVPQITPPTASLPLDNLTSNGIPVFDIEGDVFSSSFSDGLASIQNWITDLNAEDLFNITPGRNPGSGVQPNINWMEELSQLDSMMRASGSGRATTDTTAAQLPTNSSPSGPVRVILRRPHGRTAIAPGLKKVILRICVDRSKQSNAAASVGTTTDATGLSPHPDIFSNDQLPSPSLMRHLFELFDERFASQFPYLDTARLQGQLEAGQGSVFLLNCIAALTARFSTLPAIEALGDQPHEYGNVFHSVAKSLVGSMMAYPTRQTVIALLLLSQVGFGNNSESEEWMFSGMAMRMAVDLGLHLDSREDLDIDPEERRLNRLVFWSAAMLDFSLSFGTGRQPTLRVDEITQELPSETDLLTKTGESGLPPLRHPFPYAARQMLSYGRLIELLNARSPDMDGSRQKAIQQCRAAAVNLYHTLPADLCWDSTNLQRHMANNTAPIYVYLHLWMHTIIASEYLMNASPRRMSDLRLATDGNEQWQPPAPAALEFWKHSASMIKEIFVLTDLICPQAYLSLPFVNQAFYVAASTYLEEVDNKHRLKSISTTGEMTMDHGHVDLERGDSSVPTMGNQSPANPFQGFLSAVSMQSVSTLCRGLTNQARYWSGVAWVHGSLEQRIRGIGLQEIDLVSVTDKLQSVASVPDAGLIHDNTGKE